MRPVPTVPRPLIENTSSIGHQERLVLLALRHRDVAVQGVHQLVDALAGRVVLAAASAWPASDVAADDRDLVAGELVLGEQLADFHLDQVEQLGVVDGVDLVEEDDDRGTPTWRASRMCSRVCGIGPSLAATTRMAPSIWAAPVIMFLM